MATTAGAALAGITVVALLAALSGGRKGRPGPPPSGPGCSNHNPSDNEVVTCTFDTDPETGSPIPITLPITAPNSIGVTVDIDGPGLGNDGGIAYLGTGGIPVIDLGGDATVNLTGAAIADIDPATLPEILQQVLGGDARDLPDHDALSAFFAALAELGPVGPTPDAATVELGAGDPSGAIIEITGDVIVQKAKMADQAMNAITEYIISSFDPNANLPVGAADIAGTGANTVTVSDGLILSQGAAAIRTTDISGLGVRVTDGGVIATVVDNSPAIAVGTMSALNVLLGEFDPTTPSGGTILTIGDGSAGISAAGSGSALAVYMLGDGHIFTAGDNAPAVHGPGANSVTLFEARGGNGTDGLPMLATFGDNSPGIVLGGPSSTATLQIRDAYETAFGPTFQTSGANSTLFDVQMGNNSSTSFSAVNSSFGTFGDGSGVISLLTGNNSDQLVFLQNVSLSSEGGNGTLLETAIGGSSVRSIVAIGVDLTTVGDGSGGMIHRVANGGGSSADTYFVANATIATQGNDAAAFLVEEQGGSSVRTTVMDDFAFSTLGDNSAALWVGGLGDGSALEVTLTGSDLHRSSISTEGDDAPGLFIGALDSGSAWTTSIDEIDVSTKGANSTAVFVGGVQHGGSVSSLVITNAGIATEGDNSAGLLALMLVGAGSDSVTVTALNNIIVTTLGADSAGIIVGDPDVDSGGAWNNANSSSSVSANALTIQTEGDRSPGFALHGFGDGVSNSDFTAILTGSTIGTKGADSTGVLLDVFGDDLTGSTITALLGDLIVTTEGDRSAGVVIGDGLGANTGVIDSTILVVAGNLDITTLGDDSIGLIIEPVGFNAVNSDFTTTLGDITVATSGDRSHGIMLGEGLGTDLPTAASELTLTDISATTSGANAHALVIGENTTLSLAAQNHTGATTASGTIVNGTLDSFDGFVATGAGSRAVMNHGILYGTFTVGDLVVGNLGNNGLIESADGPGGVAVLFTGSTNDIFELQPLGEVIGLVDAGLGTDAFILGGEGEGTFDVSLLDADGTLDGDDQYIGFETFSKTGTSTWTLTGSNDEIELFTVNAGALLNNASLINAEIALLGGTLGGTGTVGSVTVGDGGTLSPGNSIGTLTVAGAAVFNAGSIFEVEVDADGNNDLLAAGSVAINGGVVSVIAADGDYEPLTVYTILTSTTSIVGEFDDVTSNFAFLTPSLTHNEFDIELTLERNELLFMSFSTLSEPFDLAPFAAPIEMTANQAATGRALDELPGGLPDELLTIAVDDIPLVLDSLSGEIHASGQHVIDRGSELFTRTLLSQARAGLTGGSSPATGPLGYAPSDSPESFPRPPATLQSSQAWVTALGGMGTVLGDGNASALDWWAAGLAGGYEAPVDVARGTAWAGFGLGYIRSHGAVDDRLSAMDADGFHLGGYGGWADGPWSLAGSLGIAANRISTTRRIVIGDLDRTATADYWSHTVGFSGEALYGFDMGGGTTLSPLATLDAGWSGHGGFSETGADALNLTGEAESWSRLDTGLGLALQHVVRTARDRVTLDGRAVWEHAFADTVPSQSLAFAGSPTGFTVNGPDAGRDRLRLGLGVSYEATQDMTIRASYSGLFSGSQQSHGASLGLNVKF